MNSARTTVYVELLDEGTDVWRPVAADEVRPGCFLLRGEMPAEERWAFQPGALVECEFRKLSGGSRLVAVRLAVEQRASGGEVKP
jgi:hypothetical protein